MASPSPDLAPALDLARHLVAQPDKPLAPQEQLVIAQALVAAESMVKRARAHALEEAARLLDGLADKEMLRPDRVGVYVGLAADIRALALHRGDS
ncbi:MAG TPA: hypothetical protein VMI56_23280 [Reyranella sp.]|nr:hypothetical protein [Reyranella sp.]